MTTPVFSFYCKQDYFRHLIERLDSASSSDRFALATMSFDVEYPLIQQLAASLGTAAGRGAKVNVAIDAYNFLKGRQKFVGPLLTHRQLPPQLHGEFAEKWQLIEQLRTQGVTVGITNQPQRRFTNPFAGRSHIKFAVINDRVYLGGCNLDDPDNLDFMAGWDDAVFADQLYSFSQQMTANQGMAFMAGQDRVIELSPQANVFIDAGKPGQSLIMERAWQLIDQAHSELLITSQFFPNSHTLQRLRAARRRGVEVTILYNHPSRFNQNERLPQYLNMIWSRLTVPAEFFAHQLPLDKPYLHSKVIATESGAMFGSHNYNGTGVSFGTAEIAVQIRDAAFAQKIQDFVLHDIAGHER